MYRYNTHDDFGCPSSAFTICTFWLIRALYVIGEKDEARCLLLVYINACDFCTLILYPETLLKLLISLREICG